MFRKKVSYIILSLPVFLVVVFVLFSIPSKDTGEELPLFMQIDTIAGHNNAPIEVEVLSIFKSDSGSIEIIKKDYLNIWSHLNHLYRTNNILAGKEYYTEAWFERLERNYRGNIQSDVSRKDVKHKLKILTLATDNLVCTVQDTVDLHTQTTTKQITERYLVHMALLFQGDHWRIDAVDFEALKPEILTIKNIK